MEPVIAEKATIFYQGELGMSVNKLEVRNLRIEVKPYAQYSKAVSVKFVPKGKRLARGFVQSFEPNLMVLEGWDHSLTPVGMYNTAKDAGNGWLELSNTSRYTSFDPSWVREFAAQFEAYVAKNGVKVLANFLGHDTGSR